MVIFTMRQLWDIGRYFDELKSAGLVQNKDWVYEFADDSSKENIRVGIRFLDDRYTSFYGLKWS